MRRSPLGGRGLKYCATLLKFYLIKSLPARGAWIEIGDHPLRRAAGRGSLPARGAWIEIIPDYLTLFHRKVAPRSGGVD